MYTIYVDFFYSLQTDQIKLLALENITSQMISIIHGLFIVSLGRNNYISTY